MPDLALKSQLKGLLVETLNLPDVGPEEIGDTQSLFDSDLELDSIDALELVMAVERTFGVKVKSSEESREALKDIETLAAFIESKQGQAEASG